MKKKQPEVRISLPDQKHLDHFTTALSIANAYRMAKGIDIMSLERFALNCLVEASNSLINFHEQEKRKHAAETAKQESEKEPEDDKSKEV